jgi:hypothetical protein
MGTGGAGWTGGGTADGTSGWRLPASSRSAASARCSAWGRDTSLARIAVDTVILVTGMPLLSARLSGRDDR